MVRKEICRLFKLKAVSITFFLVIITVIYSMAVYGEFGYDLSCLLAPYSNKGLIAYSEENGELLAGQEGYEKNKKIATEYAGVIDDLFLADLHTDFQMASYVEGRDGERFYNATYSYFQNVFNIGSEKYVKAEDIWSNTKEPVRYGFSGDWDAYGNIIQNFFFMYSFFVIVCCVPLFTFDRECGMTELLGTVKRGGSSLLKYKLKAVLGGINFLMFAVLIVISIVHFSQYGFDNADVSIQCSFEQKYVTAVLDCTMGQMVISRLLAGILACNILILISVLVSMLSKTTLTAFALAVSIIWLPSYPVISMLDNEYIFKLLLFIMPVNGLYNGNLLKEFSVWHTAWEVLLLQIAIFVILSFIVSRIWKKHYMALSGRE